MADPIADQIAELAASLTQPLPDAVRRLVEQQLAILRQQHTALIDLRGAQTGAISTGAVTGHDLLKGSVEVPGTLHGAAVGVNQGVVITSSTLSPNLDATQLRLLRAIAEQTGGAERTSRLTATSPVLRELGLTIGDVADELAMLQDHGYVSLVRSLNGDYHVGLTPAARKLLRLLAA